MTCTNPATWNENSRGVGGLKQKCPPWGGGMDIFWNYTFTKKRNMLGKNPLPISLLNYYSLKINFVPCHHQRVKISEVATKQNLKKRVPWENDKWNRKNNTEKKNAL